MLKKLITTTAAAAISESFMGHFFERAMINAL
jgi:hypothetical protein